MAAPTILLIVKQGKEQFVCSALRYLEISDTCTALKGAVALTLRSRNRYEYDGWVAVLKNLCHVTGLRESLV